MWQNPCRDHNELICDSDIPLDISEDNERTLDMSMLKNQRWFQQNYTMGFRVAEGSYGKVYNIFNSVDRTTDALKSFKPAKENSIFCTNITEYDIMRTCDHPNIAKIKHAILDDISIFHIIMPLYDSALTQQTVHKLNRFHPGWKVEFVQKIGDAIHYLHTMGFMHRDIKPANILYKRINRNNIDFALCDFGLAVDCKIITKKHIMRNVFCSGSFIPMETLLGSRTYDERVDVFAFGAVLYYIVVGDLLVNETGWLNLESHIQKFVQQLGVPMADEMILMSGYPRFDLLTAIIEKCNTTTPKRQHCGEWESLIQPMIETTIQKRCTMSMAMYIFKNMKCKLLYEELRPQS
jgi:serine/threonine protein kinase